MSEEEYVTIGNDRALLGPSMEFRWLKWPDGAYYGMTLQQKWTAVGYRVGEGATHAERESVEVWRTVPVVVGERPADLSPYQK